MNARFLLAVGSSALACAAAPSVVSAQTPGGDSVLGQATACGGEVECVHQTRVDFDARSGPNAENPSGTAAWFRHLGTFADIGDQGAVSCLAVSGNTAIIGFRNSSQTTRTLAQVSDGGSSPGQDSFSIVTDFVFPGPVVMPAPDCSSFPPSPIGNIRWTGAGVNDLGDIVVHDAKPFPTTKDQCKNGGWRDFGVFKNQGDCVSFVANGGKNPPGG